MNLAAVQSQDDFSCRRRRRQRSRHNLIQPDKHNEYCGSSRKDSVRVLNFLLLLVFLEHGHGLGKHQRESALVMVIMTLLSSAQVLGFTGNAPHRSQLISNRVQPILSKNFPQERQEQSYSRSSSTTFPLYCKKPFDDNNRSPKGMHNVGGSKKKKSTNPPNMSAVATSQDLDLGLDSLLEKASSYYPNMDQQLIQKAYNFAQKAHDGQFRKSGEPYFIHPVNVAHIIADLQLDVASIVTGLLHDTVEDTETTLEDIESEFGTEICHLVDGVTKIGRVRMRSRQEHQAENYRKMIVAMARDIRVILVKLADRTHNLRTLQYMKPAKQKEVATETLELYAPLAHRLGIHRLKTELEDTSFRYTHPSDFRHLQDLVEAGQNQRQAYTDHVIQLMGQYLREAGMLDDNQNDNEDEDDDDDNNNSSSIQITGRPKSIYSIHQKMIHQDLSFNDIQDLTAFRILTDSISQCYQALGVVHTHWKPVPGRFKDYIALPKPNGYQSLHTTVIGPEGKRIEVQIRTHDMHQVAEGGIAAHWMYKGESHGVQEARRFTWLRQLVGWVQQLNDPEEFMDSVKEDLFEKEVFAFSPHGQLFALPKGSIVIDFAYRVHSDLGHHCMGAKINGKMVSIKHQIQNGDTIEILHSKAQRPHRGWLKLVKTSKAKARIRSWFKRQQREESIALGREMLDKTLKQQQQQQQQQQHLTTSRFNWREAYKKKMNEILSTLDLRDEQHLFSAIGYGRVNIADILSILAPDKQSYQDPQQNPTPPGLSREEMEDEMILQRFSSDTSSPSKSSNTNSGSSHGIVVGGERNMMVHFCGNCSPLYGENVMGVISRGNGIKVHRIGCKDLLESDEDCRINVTWDSTKEGGGGGGPQTAARRQYQRKYRKVRLDVLCEDSPGVLASMSKAISSAGFNIASIVLKGLSDGRGLAKFEVILSSAEELETVKTQLEQEPNVISVIRR